MNHIDGCAIGNAAKSNIFLANKRSQNQRFASSLIDKLCSLYIDGQSDDYCVRSVGKMAQARRSVPILCKTAKYFREQCNLNGRYI